MGCFFKLVWNNLTVRKYLCDNDKGGSAEFLLSTGFFFSGECFLCAFKKFAIHQRDPGDIYAVCLCVCIYVLIDQGLQVRS